MIFGFKSKAERLQDEGIRLAERGHLDEALKYFQQALEIEPENGVFRYNFGLAYVNNSDVHNALEEFKLSIRFKPEHADSYFAIATSLFPQGPDGYAAALCEISCYYELVALPETAAGEPLCLAAVLDKKKEIRSWDSLVTNFC